MYRNEALEIYILQDSQWLLSFSVHDTLFKHKGIQIITFFLRHHRIDLGQISYEEWVDESHNSQMNSGQLILCGY